MAANEYHLTTDWRFAGTIEEVFALLRDTEAMGRWWRGFVIDLEEQAPGDAQGVGEVVALHVKGWLPYELHWTSRITQSHAPHGFSIAASGDFTGRGTWTLAQDGPDAVVHYDWRISADRPLLRYGSPILKPLFIANHRWAMDRAEEGIRLELQRLHAPTPEARAAVPLPTRPTTTPAPYLAGGLALLGAFVLLRWRSRKTY